MSVKDNPTFKDDGKRRLFCPACGRFITETHLGEQNTRNIRCKSCKSVSIIYPPKKGTLDGIKVILFGPGQAMFTGGLTEDQIEDSM